MKNQLLKRLNNKEATVAIIGLGYVGLPLALRFSDVGYPVIGIDIDSDKVEKIRAGKSYIEHIHHQKIQKAAASGLEATSDFAAVARADAVILCLPTPLSKQREPDLSFVLKTIDSILPHLHPGQVISLESTTYPGTTDEEIKPRIEAQGFDVGKDIFVIYSPEREDPGNATYQTENIPKICGGVTTDCLAIGLALYQHITNEVFPVSSTRAAEMTKLLENIHRAVNIGLVNEIKILADKMDIDIYEIISAAATKPFGFVPYYPGPGIGGHCIPVDPFYLTWKAREYGMHTRFIELAGEINNAMPQWVAHKIIDALNHQGKPIRNSKILILGIAYKKNVDDVRESPAIHLLEILVKKGAHVEYSDPYLPSFPKMREHHFNLTSVPINEQSLPQFDAVVLTTAHDLFDFELIRKHANLLIDTRGIYRERDAKIIKA